MYAKLNQTSTSSYRAPETGPANEEDATGGGGGLNEVYIFILIYL
jgi:hypothetical protein